MSAGPSATGDTPALNGQKTNGTQPVLRVHKSRPTDPLFKSKKKPGGVRPGKPTMIPKPPFADSHHAPASSGSRPPAPSRMGPHPQTSNKQIPVSGFSDPTVSPNDYRDYKLVTTKRDLINGMRHHILKFISDRPVNLQDESDFVRPVRLCRRDPKAEAIGQTRAEYQDVELSGEEKMQKEETSKRKELRQKERLATQAQTAPSAASAKMNNFKKKTAYVYAASSNLEDQKKRQLVYEEKLPWHIEDFESKHTYVGQYQATQSQLHSALSFEQDPSGQGPRFRLIPLEKMYRFAPKSTRRVMTLEEAEAAMKIQTKDPSFLARAREVDRMQATNEILVNASRLLRTAPKESGGRGAGFADEDQDLDYEADATDDEDGAGGFEDEDEDAKIAKRRIKAEQRKYNHFGNIDEKDYDDEEALEQRMAKRDRDLNKQMNRKLRKREGNYDMASESDDSYETTDSEEERQRLEDEARIKKEKESVESGASTKGTNTPAGRKEKHAGASDREMAGKKAKNLKRPNSATQSEASGTETASSRKKLKKKHKQQELSASQPNIQPPSRPASPPIPPSSAPSAPTKKRKQGIRGGAGSETDGAVTSDGGRKSKKIKAENGDTTAPPSRPNSPPPSTAPAAPKLPFPTEAEVAAAIPPEGILVKPLLDKFTGRNIKNNLQKFLAVAKTVAVYDKEKKIWKRKP